MGTSKFDSNISGAAKWFQNTAKSLVNAAKENFQNNLKAIEEGPFELKREANGKISVAANENAMRFEPRVAGVVWQGASQVVRPVVQQLAPDIAALVSKIQKLASGVVANGLPSREAGELAKLAKANGVKLEFLSPDYAKAGVDSSLVYQGAAELTAKVIARGKLKELTEKFAKSTDYLEQDDLVSKLSQIAKENNFPGRVYVSEGPNAADEFQRMAKAIADAL